MPSLLPSMYYLTVRKTCYRSLPLFRVGWDGQLWSGYVLFYLVFHDIDVLKQKPLIVCAIKFTFHRCHTDFSQTLGYFGNMKTSVCTRKMTMFPPQLVLCAHDMFYGWPYMNSPSCHIPSSFQVLYHHHVIVIIIITTIFASKSLLQLDLPTPII